MMFSTHLLGFLWNVMTSQNFWKWTHYSHSNGTELDALEF